MRTVNKNIPSEVESTSAGELILHLFTRAAGDDVTTWYQSQQR